MPRLIILLCCFIAASALATAEEDIVVIANPISGVNKLSREEVINIFLGRNRELPTGAIAFPIDLPGNSLEKDQFYSRLTGKSASEINTYWARLIFSGNALPPAQVHSQEEAIQKIIGNNRAVAYVARSKVAPAVKIVFELNSK